MSVFECGNFTEDYERKCPFCGAEIRDEPPARMSTVVVNCPGWYPNNE